MNVVSVDLGMGPDPTSLVVLEGRTWERVRLERIETRYSISFASVYRRPDGSESVGCPPPVFYLRHLERMAPGSSYAGVVSRVKGIHDGLREPVLAVDATGAGKSVVELFREAGMSPWTVTISAGDEIVESGMSARVPKRDLIATAQVMLQSGRLKIARDLSNASLLLRELQSFRMNVDLKRPSDSLAWREGVNDDLVLALAVGLWTGERRSVSSGSIALLKRVSRPFGF